MKIKIRDYAIRKDGIIYYECGGRWFTYDDLIAEYDPQPTNDYEEQDAIREVRQAISWFFDRLEFEVVGYQRPVHF